MAGTRRLAGEKAFDSSTASAALSNVDAGFSDVFSTRKPQNALAGASSGVKSAAKGIVGGTVALVALPVMGYKQEGASGLAKGAAAGVLGCVGLIGTGLCVGVSQTVRGVINTPKAVTEKLRGEKRWDEDLRQWVKDDLKEERKNVHRYEEILEQAKKAYEEATQQKAEEPSDKTVADTTLYETLGVPVTATDSQIKKAYYVLASKHHPDKSQEPDAKQKFQELSAAYQVLSNPELRAKYDKDGKEALEQHEMNTLSPDMVYTSLYGSEAFEPYIGKLKYALCFMDLVLTHDDHMELQRCRELKIALNLASLLTPYVDGHVEAFEESCSKLAAELAKASFGDRLLGAIGREYMLNARKRLSILGYSIAQAQGTADHLKVYSRMASTGWSVASKSFEMMKDEKEKEKAAQDADDGQAANRRGPEHQSMPPEVQEAMGSSLIELAFDATLLEISKTLTSAIARLLHDSVPSEVQTARAQGLLRLGTLFTEAAERERERPEAKSNIERFRDAFPGA